MSDKPIPAALPARFLRAALSVLIGSIALRLAVQLLRSMLGVFIGIGVVALMIAACLVLLRLRHRLHESSDAW